MVSREERRWALYFGLVVALVTALPYLLGYAMQGEAWRFTGYLLGVEDGNSYIAKMLSGAAGHWLFRTPYTGYPQSGVLALLPYLLLGKLSAPPGQHEQLVALYQGFRVLATVLMCAASYDFLALFVAGRGLRRLGTALAVLGGGLGWLALVGLAGAWHSSPLGMVLPGMEIPLEFYSPETFGFLMVFWLPHLAMARALLLWGLIDYLRPVPQGAGWLRKARAGLLWLGMGLMQPVIVVSGWALLAAHLAWVTAAVGVRKWRARKSLSNQVDLADADHPAGESGTVQLSALEDDLRGFFVRALRMGFISAPLVLYTLLAFRLDPYLHGWEQQNRILSPPLHHYLLGFGVVLVLAAWGVKPLLKGQTTTGLGRAAGWLPLVWLVNFPLLAYAPYTLQRRLPDGIWLALLAMALVGIERALQPNGQRWALRALAGLGFLSTLLLFSGALPGVLTPAEPLFRPAGEVRAFEFLAAQAKPDSLVLASYQTGNALPAWAPMRVMLGLGPESVNLVQVMERVACFYRRDCPASEREALLADFMVDIVWYGPHERALGDWDPSQMKQLELIYAQGDYRIYRTVYSGR